MLTADSGIATAPFPGAGKGAAAAAGMYILFERTIGGAGEGEAEGFRYAVILEIRRAGGGVAGMGGLSAEICSSIIP